MIGENGEWTQHVLAEGFKPPEPNPRPGRGSPGRAQVFFPDINESRYVCPISGVARMGGGSDIIIPLLLDTQKNHDYEKIEQMKC